MTKGLPHIRLRTRDLPSAKLRPVPPTPPYEAASQGRRLRGWQVPSSGPNQALLGGLETLRSRSRSASRNDPYAASGLTRLIANLIGTGIKPQSQAPEEDFRAAVQQLWLDWTDEASSCGQLDFYGLQTQATRSLLESGEVFIRLRPRRPEDGLTVPLQLQVLEADHVPADLNRTLPNGETIHAGIEFDRLGRRTAYWMYRSHPADSLFPAYDSGQLIPVPAEQVLHLYEPLRPGQLRGQPYLAQVLLKLQGLAKFDDATLTRQEIANLFAGFIRRPAPEEGMVDPLTGQPLEFDDSGLPMVGLEPGTVQELLPGEEIEFSKPPDAGSTYGEFMRQQLTAIAAGLGIPYEVLTGDYRGVNDRLMRVALNEMRRRIQQFQHNIIVYQFCRPVWQHWFDLAVLAGALNAPGYAERRRDYQRVKWVPQGFAYLHPVQDWAAQQLAVRCGFKTRSEVVSEQGYDAEEIDAEMAADNARADELGLVYDSDPRVTTQRGTSEGKGDAADGEAEEGEGKDSNAADDR